MLNLTLIGNLGSDPVLGATQKGSPIATLRVAVNQPRTDTTTGERIESAEWFRVRAMGRLVDHAQSLARGSRVLVIGRLDISHYQSSEREARVSYDIWADELVSLNPRTDGGRNSSERGEHQQRPAQPPTPPANPGTRTPNADHGPAGGSRTRSDAPDEEALPW
jgi:single-strand DNA-binding protein